MSDEIPDDLAWGPRTKGSHMDWFQERMDLSGLTRGVTDKVGIRLRVDDNGGNFIIPYHNVDAVAIPFYRQRNRETPKSFTNEKDQSGAEFRGRYTQPKGKHNRVYWPPLYTQRNEFTDPSIPLIVCEGELKAIRGKMACAESAINALVLGVPGTKLCENVYAELNSIPCMTTVGDIDVRRTVVLAVDWGGTGKGRDASLELAARLRDLFQRRGARVINLRWPVEEGSTEEHKLDEWLTKGGDLSASLMDSLEAEKKRDGEIQALWDRLNSKYAKCHGYYIPLWNTTLKYNGDALNTMECDIRIPVSKAKHLEAKEVWKLQPPEEQNIVQGYTFHPAPLGHDQERYVWKNGLRLLNTAPEWGWSSSPFGYETAPAIAPFRALLERLFQNHGDWYLDFLAQIAQQPTIRGHHIIILQDDGNTGKDRLFDTLDLVFARGYSGAVGTGLTSSFNSNLEHLLIAHWSDPVLSGRGGIDRLLDSILKNYSGTTMQEINHKGGAKYSVENYGRLHIAHNQGWIIKIPERERRYGVFGGNEVMPHTWAVEYMNWLNTGGVEQIRQELCTRDISNFDIFAPAPRTAKREQMELAARLPVEEWLQESPQLAHKDIWDVADIAALWEARSKHNTTPEAMGAIVRHLKGYYKFPKPIKAAGATRRFVAIRNGEHWAKHQDTEGNAQIVAEWQKIPKP